MLFRAPDSHPRSLVKAVSWRIVGSIDTFVLTWIITGKLKFAVSIAGVETLTKILIYYFHERAWDLIPWGRGRSVELADKAAAAPAPPVSTTKVSAA